MFSSASVLPASICDTSQRSKSNSGLVYFLVPGKCDIPPLATMATRSLRPLMISAIARPSAAQRCGVGRGGTYTFVKNGMTGMSRLPIRNSNGIENAWPSSASSEYAMSKL